MKHNVYIITGASRGLGKELADKLEQDNRVYRISRTEGERHDLRNIYTIDMLMRRIWRDMMREWTSSITLINNAAIIEPITLAGNYYPHEIVDNITVNLLAPMMLTSAFLDQTSNFRGNRLVVFISSGAGTKPIPGWGPYSASKAGLDNFYECVRYEQNIINSERRQKDPTYKHKLNFLHFSPGGMETDMQKKARAAREEDFPWAGTWRNYHQNHGCLDPGKVADELIEMMGGVEA